MRQPNQLYRPNHNLNRIESIQSYCRDKVLLYSIRLSVNDTFSRVTIVGRLPYERALAANKALVCTWNSVTRGVYSIDWVYDAPNRNVATAARLFIGAKVV